MTYPPDIRYSGRSRNEGSLRILRMNAEASDADLFAVTWLPYEQRGADVLPYVKYTKDQLRDFLSGIVRLSNKRISELLNNLNERRTETISNIKIPAERVRALGLG